MQRASCASHGVCGAEHLLSLGEPAIWSSQGQSSLLKSRLLVDFHRRNNAFRNKRYLKNYQLCTSLCAAYCWELEQGWDDSDMSVSQIGFPKQLLLPS